MLIVVVLFLLNGIRSAYRRFADDLFPEKSLNSNLRPNPASINTVLLSLSRCATPSPFHLYTFCELDDESERLMPIYNNLTERRRLLSAAQLRENSEEYSRVALDLIVDNELHAMMRSPAFAHGSISGHLLGSGIFLATLHTTHPMIIPWSPGLSALARRLANHVPWVQNWLDRSLGRVIEAKYIRLLDDLAKETSSHHRDVVALIDAVERMGRHLEKVRAPPGLPPPPWWRQKRLTMIWSKARLLWFGDEATDPRHQDEVHFQLTEPYARL